jgi:[ribosomal protein S5]-alanine N-acetyltransferase
MPLSDLGTERLILIASVLPHLDAELESPEALGHLLHAHVPEGWPPGEYDRPAIEFFRSRLSENPEAAGWYGWYAVRKGDAAEPAVVVGAGGYFGPPDVDHTVEIGYSIVPAFQGRGYATEMVRALVDRAFSVPGIVRVIAHTNQENKASIKVLEHCGFSLIGPGREEGTILFALDRPMDIG